MRRKKTKATKPTKPANPTGPFVYDPNDPDSMRKLDAILELPPKERHRALYGDADQPTQTGTPVGMPYVEETPEHIQARRQQYFAEAPPDEVHKSAREQASETSNRWAFKKGILSSAAHTVSRTGQRDTSAGVYMGTFDAFHQRITKLAEKGETPHQAAIDHLFNSQPYRKAIALHPDNQQPVPTFGVMQLPQSRDPIAVLEAEPGVELRPTHWTPDTPIPHMIQGALHDFGNYLTALIARQVVAVGFNPDTEAINNARSLARTLKDFQKMAHIEADRQAEQAAQAAEESRPRRKAGPGRPRKLRLPEDSPAVTLRVELVQNKKVSENSEEVSINPEESTPQPVKNNEPLFFEDRPVTSAESVAEPVKNKTTEIAGSPITSDTSELSDPASGTARPFPPLPLSAG